MTGNLVRRRDALAAILLKVAGTRTRGWWPRSALVPVLWAVTDEDLGPDWASQEAAGAEPVPSEVTWRYQQWRALQEAEEEWEGKEITHPVQVLVTTRDVRNVSGNVVLFPGKVHEEWARWIEYVIQALLIRFPGYPEGKGNAVSKWQEAASQVLADAYPADMKADELLGRVREAGFPSTAKSTLYLWLKARAGEGTVDRVAHGRYRAGKAVMEPGQHDHMVLGSGCRQCSCTPPGEAPGAQEDGPEAAPEVLRDLIAVSAGVMIPGPVIATWTPAERRQAEEWAASEHLRASDNTGIRPRPYPRLVQEAVVLAANPGMAQLAVEAWMQRKESIERELAVRGQQGSVKAAYAGSMHQETADIAQAAITGLLVLLEGRGRPGTWQERALVILGEHPGGITPAELSVLLARDAPHQEALDKWLAEGLAAGTFEVERGRNWRIRGAGG